MTEKTYWNNKGMYQKQYDKLYKSLVPKPGKAETLKGEVLRIISQLYYDYYNNGACNLANYKEEIDFLDSVFNYFHLHTTMSLDFFILLEETLHDQKDTISFSTEHKELYEYMVNQIMRWVIDDFKTAMLD